MAVLNEHTNWTIAGDESIVSLDGVPAVISQAPPEPLLAPDGMDSERFVKLLAEIQAFIAEEVKRQVDERFEQLVRQTRRQAGVRFDPMHPPSDSRGVPHRG